MLSVPCFEYLTKQSFSLVSAVVMLLCLWLQSAVLHYTCACTPLPLLPFFPPPSSLLPSPSLLFLPPSLSLHTHRSLDVNSPLYLGGLEAHLTELPVSSTSYQGCISSVNLNGDLLDLGSPLRSHGTEEGCPPLDVSCSNRECAGGEECKEMWNGTVCSCGSTCQQGESEQLLKVVIAGGMSDC